MIKRLLLFFTMLLFWHNNYAQVYNMTDGFVVNTCTGKFYDSGGPDGDYENAQQQIMTFCPDFPESAIQVVFNDFDLQENNDILFVYDGPDINSPLITTLTGSEIPLVQMASGNNPTGCLTFRFISDGYVTGRGWDAEINCVTPCQVIMAYLDYSYPSRNAQGVIRACVGQEISLGAQATFSGNGANSVYTWDLDNGGTAVGQNVTVTYNVPGIYRVNVWVTDELECRNNNIINQTIQVSPEPEVTIDLPPDICFGVDTVVTVDAVYPEITRECAPPVTGTTYLPDGDDDIYSTSLLIDCFNNDQKITDASQVARLCINMEHSYSGDLTMRLIAPDGSIAILYDQGGGATTFGHAPTSNAPIPGVGETYCFTMDAATIVNQGQAVPSNETRNMWAPGDYLPITGFENFIDSPVNGIWTLQIHDQLGQDNGYIFWWSIDFSEDIVPAEFSFQPVMESIAVPSENGVVDVTGNQFTINPEIEGELCYDVTIINDFGCPFVKRICTNVGAQIVLNEPREFQGCIDDNGVFIFDFQPVFADLSNNQLLVFSIHSSETEANEAMNALATTQVQTVSDGIVTYWVRAYNVVTGCFKVTSFTAQATDCTLNLVHLPDLSICDGQVNTFDLSQYSPIVYNNNLNYTVTYYNSEADANNQVSAIDANLLANYVGTNNETIWVRVQNINNVAAFGITFFKLFVYPVPEFYDLTPVFGCEIPGSGLANFDLSSVQAQASGLSPNIEVTFYPTIAEAEIGDIATSLPLNYTGYQGIIYVRAYNPNTACFTIMPLVTNVVDAPGANQIDPLEICDTNNDGFAIFNLIPTTIMIAGNPIPPGVQVTYHETLADANNNVNKIQDIGAYQNVVVNNQTIYVRVGYMNSTCSAIVPLQLIVHASPVIVDPTPLHTCDADNNGIANFDLTSKIAEILNGLNPLDYVVTFYTDSANANAGTNEITAPANYSNLTASTVIVRVQNIATGCFKITKLVLITDPTPVVANPVATYSLCDDNFDGFQVFDLASKIPVITGSQTGLQVTFHYSLADANSGSNPLASPYQNVVQNVQTLHVRVQRLSTGCFTTTTMDIRVTPIPVLNIPIAPIDVCSNTDSSFGTINLTSYNAQFLNGGPAYELKYFETQANAQNNVLPILGPEAYNNLQPSNPSVWVRATNPQTGCFSVYKVTFRLLVSPKMPVVLPDVVTCDVHADLFDGITPINLAQQTPLILAAQTIPGTYEVRYFTSLVLANVGTNWIANPETYLNTSNPQTIWVRVQNAAHPTSCFEVKSFNVVVNTPLPLGLPSPIALCDNGLPNDGQTTFDLTMRQGQITQGQIFGVTLKYYTNEAEAKAGFNHITNPTSYVNTSNPQTIWVSVENMHGCFSYTTLTIRVLPLPEPNLTPTALQKCETALGSGEASFDLRLAQPDLSNGNATLTYKYFITEQEAINNVGAIGTPEDFLTGSMTVYVRVSNTPTILSESCFVIVPLQLIVNSLPTIGTLTPLLACELNTDGIYTFDLRDKDPQVLGNQNPANFDVRYYVTETAALLGAAPIPYIYTNAAAYLQTIWVRVQHRVTGCYSIASLDLKVEEKVFAYPPSASLAFCDTDGVNDGFGPADITTLNAGIISTQNLTGNLGVRYYSSWANYNAGNASSSTQFPITSNPQLVIAEVFNLDNEELCTATVQFFVTMSKAPSFEPIPNGYVCTDFRTGRVNGYLMDTELPAGQYTFTWMQNGNILANNGPSHEATAAGNYTVTVTSNATGCSVTQTINVQAAPAVSIDEIKISEGFSETNVVEVIASATPGTLLEYAMDEGAYQDSNIFVDVAPGTHIIWVKVKGLNACATSKVINVLNYPKFFTPNNDGYNDTWNIFALKDQPEAKIYIFDRQGKLLKQLSPAGEGWDGTFNNKPLPSTDYWFKAEYIEPNTGLQKEATGHFTLKR